MVGWERDQIFLVRIKPPAQILGPLNFHEGKSYWCEVAGCVKLRDRCIQHGPKVCTKILNADQLLYFNAGSITPRLPASVRETSITSSSATIQWMLIDPYNPSQPETFIVSYGVTSGQLNMSTPGVTANPASQTYSKQLTSLEPATVYFYRIESRITHSTVFTQDSSFETIESSKRKLNTVHGCHMIA